MESWKRELRRRVPSMFFYALIALSFYGLSLVVPGLVRGVKLPGIEVEPFCDLDWLIWAFLLLMSLAFTGRAVYNLVKIFDPLIDRFLSKVGGERRPARRILQDLTYMLLVIIVAEAASLIAESISYARFILKTIIGVAALILLIILIYDLGRNTYKLIESKVDALIRRLEEAGGHA